MSEYTEETFENENVPETEAPVSETPAEETAVSDTPDEFAAASDGEFYTHVFAPAENTAAPEACTESETVPPETVPQFKKPEKSERKYSFATVLTSVILAALIGALSGVASVNVLLGKKTQNNTVNEPAENNTPASNITINVDEPVTSVIEAVALKVTPSVVGIRTTAAVMSFFGGSTESTEEGSGIIYSSNGYIITNYHVIKSAVESSSNSNIEVYLNSEKTTPHNAMIVGYNISNDLAVIKIDKTGLTAIELGDASKLREGQYVAAIGNPGGLEYMGSVTYGVISGLNRATSSSTEAVSLIQTDAAINPGNSGGALVNTEGKLIGVNSSKIVSTSFEGMGFAVPVDAVKEICDKIIAKENDPDPYIGVTFSEEWTAERLKRYGYPTGAVIKNTVSGGPADKARIQKGDIITEFNNVVINDFEQLNEEIAKCKPGQTVSVKIYRNGRTYATTIDVGSNNSQ